MLRTPPRHHQQQGWCRNLLQGLCPSPASLPPSMAQASRSSTSHQPPHFGHSEGKGTNTENHDLCSLPKGKYFNFLIKFSLPPACRTGTPLERKCGLCLSFPSIEAIGDQSAPWDC